MSLRPARKMNISATMSGRNIKPQPLNLNSTTNSNTRSRSSVEILYRREDPLYSSNSNDLRARIQSEHLRLIDELKNKRSELESSLMDSMREIRTLRTLLHRQERALANYEAQNADLPRLMRQHEAEMRCLVASNRKFATRNRDLEREIKKKDSIILDITERNRFLCDLNKSKGLKDRHALSAKVSVLESKLLEKQEENRLLTRRMQYQTKQYKKELANNQKLMKLADAEISKLRKEVERLQTMMPIKHKHECGPQKFEPNEVKLNFSSGSSSESYPDEVEVTKSGPQRYLKKQIQNFKKKKSEKAALLLKGQPTVVDEPKQEQVYATPVGKVETSTEIIQTPTAVAVETAYDNPLHVFCEEDEKLLEDLMLNREDVKAEMNKLYFQHSHVSPQIYTEYIQKLLKSKPYECPDSKDSLMCALMAFLKDPKKPTQSLSDESMQSTIQFYHELNEKLKDPTITANHPFVDAVHNMLITKATEAEHKSAAPVEVSDETARISNNDLTKSTTHAEPLDAKVRNVAYVEPVTHIKQSRPNSKTKSKKSEANNMKEREAFLDIFCRQAKSLQEPPKTSKRNSVAGTVTVKMDSASRKQKLMEKLHDLEETLTD